MNWRTRAVGGLVFACGIVGLATAAPAAAASSAISDVVVAGQQVHLVFTTKGLPADATVDPAHATVTVDGRPVAATVVAPGGLKRATVRSTVLLVDTSGSMAGNGITGARTAATAFLDDVARDVKVGLIGFSDTTRVLAKPTSDRTSVKSAVAKLTAAGDTSLYDALLVADQVLGNTGERRVLILSDGADTTSHATVDQVSTKLARDHVQVDAVSFRTQPGSNAGLKQVVSTTNGTVYQAVDTSQLAAAFTTAAKAYDQRLSVAFGLPQGLAGTEVAVALTVPTSVGPQHANAVLQLTAPSTAAAASTSATPSPTATATTPLVTPSAVVTTPAVTPPASAAPAASGTGRPGKTLSRNELLMAAAALGLGFLVFLLLALDLGRAHAGRRSTLKRVNQFSLRGGAVPAAAAGHGLRDSVVARSAVELAGRIVERRDPEQKLRMLLDRAAIPLRPSEWLLALLGAAFVGTVLASLVVRNPFLGVLIGAPVGAGALHGLARVKARRRLNAFLAALPDALQLSAGSLATGYSLPQALDTIVRQGTDPMAGEIGRALAQARLGIPLEDALQELAERMQSKDFEWVVMAIRINREVGGNLSEVLTTVARTLREREQLRRHVRGLSAEGRLSAYILVALPLGVGSFLFSFRRSYIRPLYTEPVGILMLSAAVLLVVTGALWMRSLVKVEV